MDGGHLTVDQVAHWFSIVQEVPAAVPGIKIALRACQACGAIVPDTDDGVWLEKHVRWHQTNKEQPWYH